jgi:hypothetical protein
MGSSETKSSGIAMPIMIKPGSQDEASEILSNLTVGVAKRMGIEMKPYDTSATQDASGEVHWMFRFDAYESRIYRVQKGLQRLVDIDLGNAGLLDLEDIETQIQLGIQELNAKSI